MPGSAKGWVILIIFALVVWFVYSRFVASKLGK